MLFNSYPFLFFFLPAAMLGMGVLRRFAPRALQVAWVGVISLAFYALWNAQFLPPLLAFGVVYLASLVALFVSSFWTVNPFTTEIEHIWNLDNFRTLWESSAYRTIALRTIGIAAAVTLADAVLAFPLAYFMARIASARSRTFLFVAVLLPLWSSYLVRVYIWRLILNQDGVLNWTLGKLGLPDVHLAYTNFAVWLVFTYVWLPFMILPVFGAVERIPHSYIEASRDLGASGFATFRSWKRRS